MTTQVAPVSGKRVNEDDSYRFIAGDMLELNQEYGVSLVMVTHNLELAKRMDSVHELHDGLLQ